MGAVYLSGPAGAPQVRLAGSSSSEESRNEPSFREGMTTSPGPVKRAGKFHQIGFKSLSGDKASVDESITSSVPAAVRFRAATVKRAEAVRPGRDWLARPLTGRRPRILFPARRLSTVNAAFLLMTSACLAGADFQPPAAAAAPPAAAVAPVAVAAAPCGGCSTGCDTGCASSCQKASLLDKIRARLHSRQKTGCCTAAPACNTCQAAPTCNTCAAAPSCRTLLFHKKDSCSSCSTGGCGGTGACDPSPKVSLFDKVRAHLASAHSHKSSCDSGCGGGCSAPSCGGCGAAPVVVTPAAPGGTAPAPMPMGEKKQS